MWKRRHVVKDPQRAACFLTPAVYGLLLHTPTPLIRVEVSFACEEPLPAKLFILLYNFSSLLSTGSLLQNSRDKSQDCRLQTRFCTRKELCRR